MPTPLSATPFVTWKSLPPLFGTFSLTYLDIPPCSGASSCPLLPLVGSKLNPPHPPLSPSLTPPVPFVQCMPSQDDITISASHSPIHGSPWWIWDGKDNFCSLSLTVIWKKFIFKVLHWYHKMDALFHFMLKYFKDVFQSSLVTLTAYIEYTLQFFFQIQ